MNAETLINKLSPLLKENENKLIVMEYTSKSCVVFGNSISIKKALMQLGGKYNSKLKKEGEQTPGWVFPLDKKSQITKFLNDINTENSVLSLTDVKIIIDSIFKENEELLLKRTTVKVQMADYNSFVAKRMEEHKANTPDMSFVEIMGLISKEWESI